MTNFSYATLKVTNLLLSTDNPRLEPVENQSEAIRTMVEKEKKGLLALAKDIYEKGVNPSDLTIVVPNDENKNRYIVMEGNRRVTTLKLLLTPEILRDIDQGMYKQIKKIRSKESVHNINSIYCVVFSDRDSALHWMKIKHMGQQDGVGTVPWNSLQKDRFEAQQNKKPKSLSLQVIEFLTNKSNYDERTLNKLKNISTTNLDRLLQDKEVRNKLGIKKEDGVLVSYIDEVEVLKGLGKIIGDIANEEINVKDIYYKDDRKNYIDSIEEAYKPDLTKTVSTKWTLEIGSNANPAKNTVKDVIPPQLQDQRPKTLPPTTNRKKLIHSSFSIKIEDKRIRNMFRELKGLDVDEFTNCAAISLRVFVELSTDFYIDKNEISNANANDSLQMKISKVSDYMQENSIMSKDELKPVRKSLSAPNSIFSPNTLNAYIHNRHIHPIANELKLTWDNFQGYISRIFQ